MKCINEKIHTQSPLEERAEAEPQKPKKQRPGRTASVEGVQKCFKCNAVKPLTDFYAHPMMANGRLGKCKDCTKLDTAARVKWMLATDPTWIYKERDRCRKKSAKARADGKWKQPSRESKERYRKANMHKGRARVRAQRAQNKGILQKPESCSACGLKTECLDKHHPDYSQPLFVQWLCKPCHGIAHRKP